MDLATYTRTGGPLLSFYDMDPRALEQGNRARFASGARDVASGVAGGLRSAVQASQGVDERLSELLRYYLGPTGIPGKVGAATQLLDPGTYDMANASATAIDPATSPADRRAATDELALFAALAPLGLMGGRAVTGEAQAAKDAMIGGDRLADPLEYSVGGGLSPRPQRRAAANKPSSVRVPGLGEVGARPVAEIRDAADQYMLRHGLLAPNRGFSDFDPERARLIGAEYALMRHDPSNPQVRRSYDAMIDETLAQYQQLKDAGIDIRFLRDGMSDPYAASPSLGYQDLVDNGRLWVFPTDYGFGTRSAFDPAENPLLRRVGRIGDKDDAVANDAFRAVHDLYGHFGPGNPMFRHKGEERAWEEHSRMYGPEARNAMTAETRGQNSWLNFGPYGEANRTALGADTVFADQKAGVMPDWVTDPAGYPDPERRGILDAVISRWGR